MLNWFHETASSISTSPDSGLEAVVHALALHLLSAKDAHSSGNDFKYSTKSSFSCCKSKTEPRVVMIHDIQ
jgi:hypothetical protein